MPRFFIVHTALQINLTQLECGLSKLKLNCIWFSWLYWFIKMNWSWSVANFVANYSSSIFPKFVQKKVSTHELITDYKWIFFTYLNTKNQISFKFSHPKLILMLIYTHSAILQSIPFENKCIICALQPILLLEGIKS